MDSLQAGPAAGGLPSLEAVYRAHGKAVLTWAARLGGPSVDASDVLQEVFLVVQDKLASFRGEARLSTWLYAITLRVALQHRKRVRWQQRLHRILSDQPKPQVPWASQDADQREASQLLYRLLDRLPENQRTAFILYELEERSGEEIAELMNARVGTVWVWLHRAREKYLQAVKDAQSAGELPR